jgi:hypothetical protein
MSMLGNKYPLAFQHIQLVLLWALLSTIMLPSLLSFVTVSIIFCLSTISLMYKNIVPLWKQTQVVWIGVLVFIGIGIAASSMPEKSAKAGYDVARYLFLFFFITPLLRKSSDKEISQSLFYFSLLTSYLLFILVVYAQISESTLQLRSSQLGSKIWGSHNLLATGFTTFTALILCLISVRAISLKQSLVVIFPLLYGIIFSLSRGNILALAAITILLFYHHRRFSNLFIYISLVVVMLAYIYLFFIFDCVNDSCNLLIYPRQLIYQNTLSQILDAPLFGHGLSVFKYISGITEGGVNVVMPHNLVLEIFYSVGVIGAIVLISSLLCWLSRSGWSFSYVQKSKALPLPVLFALVLLTYLCVRGMFDLKLVSSQTFGLLAVIAALIYSRSPKVDRPTKSHP